MNEFSVDSIGAFLDVFLEEYKTVVTSKKDIGGKQKVPGSHKTPNTKKVKQK